MTVPLCRPDVGREELDAIAKVFAAGTLSHGPEVREFERLFAERIGVRHAIALNSCTSALYLLCLYIYERFGRGEVIVPSFTFVASANSICCAGLVPRFVDVEWSTGLITAREIAAAINERTRGIMVVHYAGQPCAMTEISALAREHNLVLIEDCAECLGPKINGKSVGSFGYGTFSFYSTKNITTGEGGMITTDDDDLAIWARLRMAHGVSKGSYARDGVVKKWYRNAVVSGHNFRLSNIQAAMGIVQLRRLDDMNSRRVEVAGRYAAALSSMKGIEYPESVGPDRNSYQMYPIKVEAIKRDRILEYLNSVGIEASAHFDPPVHWQGAYNKGGPSLSVTEALARSVITLPISSVQTNDETDYVIDNLRKALKI
jgi:dTDP-4-amino-4,6-dideoxygalactose transaminase